MEQGRGWHVRAGWLSSAVALLAVALVSCGMRPQPAESQPSGEGPGRREQPLALDPQQELEIGRRAYQEVMAEHARRLLPPDHHQVRRAREVMHRLIKASQIEPLQREINLRVRGYRFEWEINVIEDRQVNAFCLPAGKMFLYTGILDEKLIGENDNFLATVISHEMAHALAHHGSERIARDRSGGSVLRKLYYEREQEAEADHVGVFLMAFAGFDPHQASAFWLRMRDARGGRREQPEWLSDHPSHKRRAEMLGKWAKHAEKGKEAFDQGRIAPPKK